MRLLIVYGSTEGHTHEVAHHIAQIAEAEGHEVETLNAAALDSAQDPYWFDAVIVGGSVHQGRHQSSIRKFVLTNRSLLKKLPGAFFSVSLSAAVKDEVHQAEAQEYIEAFLADMAWQPGTTASFAGAVKHAEYDYFREMILKVLARQLGPGIIEGQDVIYTDWEAVENFVKAFLTSTSSALEHQTAAKTEP